MKPIAQPGGKLSSCLRHSVAEGVQVDAHRHSEHSENDAFFMLGTRLALLASRRIEMLKGRNGVRGASWVLACVAATSVPSFKLAAFLTDGGLNAWNERFLSMIPIAIIVTLLLTGVSLWLSNSRSSAHELSDAE